MDSIDFALAEAKALIDLTEGSEGVENEVFGENLFFLLSCLGVREAGILHVVCPLQCSTENGSYKFKYVRNDEGQSEADIEEVDEKFLIELLRYIKSSKREGYADFHLFMSSAQMWVYSNIKDEDTPDIIKFLTDFLSAIHVITDIRTAGSVYFALRFLGVIVGRVKFSAALDIDRRVPLEYIMRSSANNLHHYSRNLPRGSQAEFYCVSLCAEILVLCSIYSGDRYVFKNGRDCWSEVYEIAEEFHGDLRYQVIKYSCVDLNNWGANRADIDAVNESISLMESCAFHESFDGDGLIHSGYVLAFAYSAKAALLKQSDQQKAREFAAKAVEVIGRCFDTAKTEGLPDSSPSLVSTRSLLEHVKELGLAD